MKKEKSEHKNYIDMEVYLADIKRYRETAETQKMLLDKLLEENKNLKEQLERMKTDTMYDMEDINSLYKENKNLKEELSKLKDKYGDIDY